MRGQYDRDQMTPKLLELTYLVSQVISPQQPGACSFVKLDQMQKGRGNSVSKVVLVTIKCTNSQYKPIEWDVIERLQ